MVGSALFDRIAGLHKPGVAKNYVDKSSDLTVVGLNWAATDIPLVKIKINANGVSYEELQPLIAADGAPIAATMTGQWGQLYRVGRMG